MIKKIAIQIMKTISNIKIKLNQMWKDETENKKENKKITMTKSDIKTKSN
jgi:hypothetical protein